MTTLLCSSSPSVSTTGHSTANPTSRLCRGARIHGVVTLRYLAPWMRAPRHSRLVGFAVEWPVVDTLGLEEHNRVVIFDRADQQSLGIIGIGRHHNLDPADVRKDRLRALRVSLPAPDATATGRTNSDRRRKLTCRPVPQSGKLADDLVESRVDVVSELDLRDGPQ